MNLHLKNKVIVITGAAKGIGQGIAEVLAAEGAIAVIVGRNAADNDIAVNNIVAKGGTSLGVVAELSNPDDCENAIKQIAEKYGTIDGLVNNAGVNDGVGLEHGNYKSFVESYHKNAVHYFLMAHFALPYLKISKYNQQNCRNRTRWHKRLCS
jgi:L-fucose dehydrogenase